MDLSLFADIFAAIPKGARLFPDDVIPGELDPLIHLLEQHQKSEDAAGSANGQEGDVAEELDHHSSNSSAHGVQLTVDENVQHRRQEEGAISDDDDDDETNLVAAVSRQQRKRVLASRQQQQQQSALPREKRGDEGPKESCANGLGAVSEAPTSSNTGSANVFELLEDDEAVQDALAFTLGNPLYDPDEEEGNLRRRRRTDVGARDTAQEAGAAHDAAGGSATEHPPIAAGDGLVHKGVCCNFNADRDFGFIRPRAKDHPDLYFTTDCITRTPPPDSGDLTQYARLLALIPVMLFPNEDIEFRAERREGSTKLVAVDITGPQRQPVRAQSAAVLTRRMGVIRHWNNEKHYGFIAPEDGQSDVFFHASAVVWDPMLVPPRPQGGGRAGAAAGGAHGAHLVEVGFIVEYSAYDRPGQKPCAIAITDSALEPLHPGRVKRSEHYKPRAKEAEDPSSASSVLASNQAAGSGAGHAAGAGAGVGSKRSREDLIINFSEREGLLAPPTAGHHGGSSIFGAAPALPPGGQRGIGSARGEPTSGPKPASASGGAGNSALPSANNYDADDGYADW